MMHEMTFAGFGGQGVLLAGQLLTYAGLVAKKEISWMPAYGPEMRGGTASCAVIISDKLIGSPAVTKPDVLIAFNKPSLDRFAPNVKPNGLIIVNSSLCDEPVKREDVRVIYVPMNQLATELDNPRALNIIALGAVVGATDVVPLSALQTVFSKKFGHKPAVLDANMIALARGIKAAGAEIQSFGRTIESVK